MKPIVSDQTSQSSIFLIESKISSDAWFFIGEQSFQTTAAYGFRDSSSRIKLYIYTVRLFEHNNSSRIILWGWVKLSFVYCSFETFDTWIDAHARVVSPLWI